MTFCAICIILDGSGSVSLAGADPNFKEPQSDQCSSSSSEDDSIEFFRIKRRYDFDSSESEPEVDEELLNIEYRANFKPLSTYVYIDDFNSIESLRLKNMPSHITTNKCKLNVRALKSERLFGRVNELASDVGMKVNSSKTQMLCIHPCVHNEVETHIRDEDKVINSLNELKILGFYFDRHPNANHHIRKTISKFHSKLWTLRFLKRSKLSQARLLDLYYSMVRSAVEYSSVVYHSMMTKTLSASLERVQRHALRIIYGWDQDIRTVMEVKGIQTLEERRQEAVLNFALKNEEKERYGKRWFRPNNNMQRNVRPSTGTKYIMPFCRTERALGNPVTNMTRALNAHHSG